MFSETLTKSNGRLIFLDTSTTSVAEKNYAGCMVHH